MKTPTYTTRSLLVWLAAMIVIGDDFVGVEGAVTLAQEKANRRVTVDSTAGQSAWTAVAATGQASGNSYSGEASRIEAVAAGYEVVPGRGKDWIVRGLGPRGLEATTLKFNFGTDQDDEATAVSVPSHYSHGGNDWPGNGSPNNFVVVGTSRGSLFAELGHGPNKGARDIYIATFSNEANGEALSGNIHNGPDSIIHLGSTGDDVSTGVVHLWHSSSPRYQYVAVTGHTTGKLSAQDNNFGGYDAFFGVFQLNDNTAVTKCKRVFGSTGNEAINDITYSYYTLGLMVGSTDGNLVGSHNGGAVSGSHYGDNDFLACHVGSPNSIDSCNFQCLQWGTAQKDVLTGVASQYSHGQGSGYHVAVGYTTGAVMGSSKGQEDIVIAVFHSPSHYCQYNTCTPNIAQTHQIGSAGSDIPEAITTRANSGSSNVYYIVGHTTGRLGTSSSGGRDSFLIILENPEYSYSPVRNALQIPGTERFSFDVYPIYTYHQVDDIGISQKEQFYGAVLVGTDGNAFSRSVSVMAEQCAGLQSGSSSCSSASAGEAIDVNNEPKCRACAFSQYGQLHSNIPNGMSLQSRDMKCYDFSSSCSHGYYNSYRRSCTNGKNCIACPIGTYNEVQGSNVCTSCSPGTYQDGISSTSCKQCPGLGKTFLGAFNVEQCKCHTGTYGAPTRNPVEPCLPCPGNAVCEYDQRYPLAMKGFWFSVEPGSPTRITDVLVCTPEAACPAMTDVAEVSPCAEGYEGEACSSCAAGYYRIYGGCAKCDVEPMSTSQVVMIVILVLVLLVLVFAACGMSVSLVGVFNSYSLGYTAAAHTQTASSGGGSCSRVLATVGTQIGKTARSIGTLITPLTKTVRFLQIANVILTVNVNFPEFLKSFQNMFSIFVLGFETVIQAECRSNSEYTYYYIFLFKMLLPILAMLMFAGIYGLLEIAIRSMDRQDRLMDKYSHSGAHLPLDDVLAENSENEHPPGPSESPAANEPESNQEPANQIEAPKKKLSFMQKRRSKSSVSSQAEEQVEPESDQEHGQEMEPLKSDASQQLSRTIEDALFRENTDPGDRYADHVPTINRDRKSFKVSMRIFQNNVPSVWSGDWLFVKPKSNQVSLRESQATACRIFVVVLNVLYVILHSSIVKVFACVERSAGEYFLFDDSSIQCYSGGVWALLASTACICFILYSLGIPIISMTFMISKYMDFSISRKREEAIGGSQSLAKDRKYRSHSWMWEPYEDRFFWWEGVEYLQKFCLPVCLSFVMFGYENEICGMLVVTSCFLILHLLVRPFQRDVDDQVEFNALLCLVLITFVGVMSESEDSDGFVTDFITFMCLSWLCITIAHVAIIMVCQLFGMDMSTTAWMKYLGELKFILFEKTALPIVSVPLDRLSDYTNMGVKKPPDDRDEMASWAAKSKPQLSKQLRHMKRLVQIYSSGENTPNASVWQSVNAMLCPCCMRRSAQKIMIASNPDLKSEKLHVLFRKWLRLRLARALFFLHPSKARFSKMSKLSDDYNGSESQREFKENNEFDERKVVRMFTSSEWKSDLSGRSSSLVLTWWDTTSKTFDASNIVILTEREATFHVRMCAPTEGQMSTRKRYSLAEMYPERLIDQIEEKISIRARVLHEELKDAVGKGCSMTLETRDTSRLDLNPTAYRMRSLLVRSTMDALARVHSFYDEHGSELPVQWQYMLGDAVNNVLPVPGGNEGAT